MARALREELGEGVPVRETAVVFAMRIVDAFLATTDEHLMETHAPQGVVDALPDHRLSLEDVVALARHINARASAPPLPALPRRRPAHANLQLVSLPLSASVSSGV